MSNLGNESFSGTRNTTNIFNQSYNPTFDTVTANDVNSTWVGFENAQSSTVTTEGVSALEYVTTSYTGFIGYWNNTTYPTISSYSQATNKSTAVNISAPAGTIEMSNAQLNANTSVTFSVHWNGNEYGISSTDVMIVNVAGIISSGSLVTSANYEAYVSSVASGSFAVTVKNINGSNLSENVQLNYMILKNWTS